ncbi:NAD(P)/FAD-dependent oxidoreductase [Candidatus Igneacidithiobacillus taiwanensis]|uniref:NAD(P)/FAD-dependent oxidoreductase n=1 Tax=Candidatus Igneacidithiobacillus taiwanensis TaxID=1945924 RepID=UPI0028A1DA44|nr:NAD(P)/FAD-dependent oxidoreductase [Candidatus Igneacidithiobacillus taiwanensis]MCE5361203.1 NAD(P)/FAD-dependent oxidoreductase [Acidithiobacillus sp.]
MRVVDCDVLVVGVGPGGAAAARATATAGLRTLAIDKRREIGVPVQCAEFVPMPLMRSVRETLSQVQEVSGMLTILPSGAREHSVFPGLMIDRARFDQGLAKLAEDAGAEIWQRSQFRSWDGEIATVLQEQEAVAVRPRFLLGADGPHSAVAEAFGVPPQPIVFTRQYTVPLLQPYQDTDIFLSDAFPGGYGWLFPRGPVANLGLGADRRFADNLKAPLELLHQQMQERGLVGAEILGRTGGAIPVGGLRPMVHERALLIGDAAGLTHPITGAGIPAAVISGEAAGRAVAAWLAGDADALQEYEEDMTDQFGPALQRAIERRRALEAVWHQPAAQEDRVMRSGWIAFPEYFAA